MRSQLFLVLLIATLPSLAHAAMSEAACENAWTAADVDKDGALTATEAPRVFAQLRTSDKAVAGDKLMRADYLSHCKAGAIDMRMKAVDAGAPLPGANSFTEAQARDRAIAAGVTDVSALKKDDQGIWRGTAKRDGASTPVAIDFKGNVVAK